MKNETKCSFSFNQHRPMVGKTKVHLSQANHRVPN